MYKIKNALVLLQWNKYQIGNQKKKHIIVATTQLK